MLNVKGIVGFDAREVAIQLHGKKGGEIGLPKCVSFHVANSTQELRTHLRNRTKGYLFETDRHAAFSPRRIQQLVKETADLAGITKRVTPHTLRHSVATTLLEHGMPLEQIQQFLGHAQLDTTQIYAASTTAMIKESYQQALSR